MRPLAVLFLALLAGCAPGVSRQEVLRALVGRPESEAIRVLGVPNRSVQANGHTFLAFDERRFTYAPALAPWGPYGLFGYGYYDAPAIPVEWRCETTLEVADGRVVGWSLRGDAC
jgi:hypothetical protein